MGDPQVDAFDSAIAELLRRREQRRVAADVDTDDGVDHEQTAETYDRVIAVLREARHSHAEQARGEGTDAEVVLQTTAADGTERRLRIEPTGVLDLPWILAEQRRDPATGTWDPVGTEGLADFELTDARSLTNTDTGP